MRYLNFKKTFIVAAVLLALSAFNQAQNTKSQASERNIRAHLDFLASDAMQGRGSMTQFEWLAGQYIASQLQQYGIEPAGQTDAAGKTTYIQSANLNRTTFVEVPKLSYTAKGAAKTFEHGKEMLILRGMTLAQIAGELQKITLDDKPRAGAIAFIKLRAGENTEQVNSKLPALLASGAAAVIIEETTRWRQQWDATASRGLTSVSFADKPPSAGTVLITVSKEAANSLAEAADGTPVEIKGKQATEALKTWNVVGKLAGSDAKLSPEVILLSAHMDHLGVRPNTPGEDKIFNGADDDASGCVAVLELARILGSGAAPKRSVYFAFFGTEEIGGFGAQHFVNNLPFAKDKFIANLEFEMIGRPDNIVAADQLWLTGYDRSNLGPELAKRGAKIVNDPHPEQNFFQRSDNYTLARQGIIAHTVSSYGLHTDYHKPSDEVKTINFEHMTRAISSMVEPVLWLVNSDFKPVWNEGKKP